MDLRWGGRKRVNFDSMEKLKIQQIKTWQLRDPFWKIEIIVSLFHAAEQEYPVSKSLNIVVSFQFTHHN